MNFTLNEKEVLFLSKTRNNVERVIIETFSFLENEYGLGLRGGLPLFWISFVFDGDGEWVAKVDFSWDFSIIVSERLGEQVEEAIIDRLRVDR